MDSMSSVSPVSVTVNLRFTTSSPLVSSPTSLSPLNHKETLAFFPESFTLQSLPDVVHSISSSFWSPCDSISLNTSPSFASMVQTPAESPDSCDCQTPTNLSREALSNPHPTVVNNGTARHSKPRRGETNLMDIIAL